MSIKTSFGFRVQVQFASKMFGEEAVVEAVYWPISMLAEESPNQLENPIGEQIQLDTPIITSSGLSRSSSNILGDSSIVAHYVTLSYVEFCCPDSMFAEESPPSRPPPQISSLPTHLLLNLIWVKALLFLLHVPLSPQCNPPTPSIPPLSPPSPPSS